MAAVASAHDFAGAGRKRGNDDATRLLAAKLDAAAGDAARREGIRAVFDTFYRWRRGATLKVCFYGGTADLRSRIGGVAKLWTEHMVRVQGQHQPRHVVNLTLDFGPTGGRDCADNDNNDIRVAFIDKTEDKDNNGYWSYVGKQSIEEWVQRPDGTWFKRKRIGPTLNLDSFDTAPPADEAEFRGLVLHEFGHALGFQHEHQSPKAPICDFNEVLIRHDYGWPVTQDPNEDDYLLNMTRLKNENNQYNVTAYDRKSVMHYWFPRRYYLNTKKGNPNCYIPGENTSLSRLDLASIKENYPFGNSDPTRSAGEARFPEFQSDPDIRAFIADYRRQQTR